MGFSQALSGLNAAATNLDVVGNNIANSQTVGFKSSSAQFADVYAGAKTGLGTRVSAVLQDFSNGTLESTGRNLDLAISGEGFFTFDQGGQLVYARNGQLNMTSQGFLENAQGGRLTAYPNIAGSPFAEPEYAGAAEPLQISAEGLAARATEQVEASLNLKADAPTIPAGTFDASNPSTYSYSNNATVYDSLGVEHNVQLFFIKTADAQWNVQAQLDGNGGSLADLGDMTFTDSGVLDTGAVKNPVFTGLANNAAALDFEIDFTGTTQFGGDSTLNNLGQDGYTSGALVGLEVDNTGNVIGKYDNEQAMVLGRIAVANFRNPEGLQSAGDNAWLATAASGQPLAGVAGVGQFGEIESGVIETSNVDLTKELVDLIIAQRNYQANSQTIKVQDEVLQNAVNLR